MMALNKKRYIVIDALVMCFIVLWILTGCTHATTPRSNNGCIQPPIQVAYPYKTFLEPGDEYLPTTLPPKEWEPQLSTEQSKQLMPFPSAISIVAQSNDRIWLTTGHELICYQSTSRTLKTYTIESSDGKIFLPNQLFLSRDGTLWGVGHGSLSPSLLSKYDAENDRFEFVLDQEGVLAFISGAVQVAEDTQGLLWLIADQILYSFDPDTLQAHRALDQQSYLFQSVIGAPDGAIWLAATETEETFNKPFIIRYDNFTDEIKHYGHPPGIIEGETVENLYFDSAGRLWADDYGWLEFSTSNEAVWYRIVRSPVFITRAKGGEFKYSWYRPSHIYESSNGFFWFPTLGLGLVKLNLQDGEWCLVTTLDSPIAEDTDHNLWLAGEHQLYKYHLSP